MKPLEELLTESTTKKDGKYFFMTQVKKRGKIKFDCTDTLHVVPMHNVLLGQDGYYTIDRSCVQGVIRKNYTKWKPNKRYFSLGFADDWRRAFGEKIFYLRIFKTTDIEPDEAQDMKKGKHYIGLRLTVYLPRFELDR